MHFCTANLWRLQGCFNYVHVKLLANREIKNKRAFKTERSLIITSS